MRYVSHLSLIALITAIMAFTPLETRAAPLNKASPKGGESIQLFRRARNTFTFSEKRADSRLAQRSVSLLARGRLKLSQEILRNYKLNSRGLQGLEHFARTTLHVKRHEELTTFFENSHLGEEPVISDQKYNSLLRLVASAYASKR